MMLGIVTTCVAALLILGITTVYKLVDGDSMTIRQQRHEILRLRKGLILIRDHCEQQREPKLPYIYHVADDALNLREPTS